jgi:hypothetical protein
MIDPGSCTFSSSDENCVLAEEMDSFLDHAAIPMGMSLDHFQIEIDIISPKLLRFPATEDATFTIYCRFC